MTRLGRAAWWMLPPALCLWLHRYGLLTWFQQDDFAWLGLGLSLHSWADLPGLLFAPHAQGTIRPWSERLFFLSFHHAFGLNPLPFHAWVFLTQTAAIAVLQSLVRRLSGSATAGFAAAVFWSANVGLSTPLSWVSAYNQVLCGLFLLAAFRLYLAWAESGRERLWWAQVAVFLAGFGALEINVVYPALATAYAVLCRRDLLRRTLWLFLPSAAFIALHTAVAAKPTSGPYAQHWDAGMLATLNEYWWKALSGGIPVEPVGWSAERLTAAGWAIGAALLAHAVWRLWRGDGLPAWGLAWFVIVLSPVLPLRDHISEYYLAVPAIGLAAAGGCALRDACAAGRRWLAAAALVSTAYLALSIPVTLVDVRWWHERGEPVRRLVEGVARAAQLHPGKTILLAGVSPELFWTGVYDRPFRILGIQEVYLAPFSEAAFGSRPVEDPAGYVAEPAETARAIDEQRAVVYTVAGPALQNITALFRPSLGEANTGPPAELDAARAGHAPYFGPGWYEAEPTHRWMGRRAEATLQAPRTPPRALHLEGFCPPALHGSRPLLLRVELDGRDVGSVALTPSGERFVVNLPLAAPPAAGQTVRLTLTLDRTAIPPGETRELGLSFGRLALR
jgi:hypothetical protein